MSLRQFWADMVFLDEASTVRRTLGDPMHTDAHAEAEAKKSDGQIAHEAFHAKLTELGAVSRGGWEPLATERKTAWETAAKAIRNKRKVEEFAAMYGGGPSEWKHGYGFYEPKTVHKTIEEGKKAMQHSSTTDADKIIGAQFELEELRTEVSNLNDELSEVRQERETLRAELERVRGYAAQNERNANAMTELKVAAEERAAKAERARDEAMKRAAAIQSTDAKYSDLIDMVDSLLRELGGCFTFSRSQTPYGIEIRATRRTIGRGLPIKIVVQDESYPGRVVGRGY